MCESEQLCVFQCMSVCIVSDSVCVLVCVCVCVYLLEFATVPICMVCERVNLYMCVCVCVCVSEDSIWTVPSLPVGRGTTWLSVNHGLTSDLLRITHTHKESDTHTHT